MLFRNPDVENELIENFEKYLPYFIEYDKVISNTSVFTSAIQNYYFNGNVTLGIAHNITEVSSRVNMWITVDKIISLDDR